MAPVRPSHLLELRLIKGERTIAAAEARGEDVTHLVDFWIRLLAEYEDAVDLEQGMSGRAAARREAER